ncbi:peptidase M22, glycoprotease [Schizophyllum commune H4-8]|uniref:peptidase M22, glycoprotease n=1 Tax=Schizophyllum commune (strain H4-8 / FGSC 9210) TaxID=578458 RepID=UPI00215F3D01|nr:peptidase M22, glycoprotease [Schizophyllum commune H4-8]KAI5889718.1 peptidase M22, glycoprotease [Schizophyllum commune H4-8]
MLPRTLPCRRHTLSRIVNTVRRRGIKVLALESSADDTCAAVLDDEKVLANVVIKQHAINAQYGGIYPYAAIEAHQKNMPSAIRRALSESGVGLSELDGIAITRGPGMGGCLGVCTNAGKAIAAALDKPIVGVHHMQAHALTALFTSPKDSPVRFPFLTLLISGGHTMIVLATSLSSFQILADTRDSAIGRAFDKVARSLEIESGDTHLGAALETFCAENSKEPSSSGPPLKFSRCMPGKLAFSYGGLHSQVDRYLENHGGVQNLDVDHRRIMARAFQEAAAEQLAEKLKLALDQCLRRGIQVGDVVASGGVASNTYIRRKLHSLVKTYDGVALNFPPPSLCTDNAVMIGWASLHRFRGKDYDDYSINPMSKWSIEDLAPKDSSESIP